ncbi:tripartite ATP-independent transporter solute receptor, DctP family [Pseudobutyrivibrio sp. YE44]|uniref:TRAP transporter substrate-binding protein n=1 Tax=Pseudobutyrivibrio sp. YE44 TaxID=1520802 RepID=UPI000882D87D|nr:TRAP transporter substrate-binding protein [Pseudobutyrivibrio sp. YE44]SDB24584.1 tripartite ATP-independent transporter solute receptor, DctP family [Pseudobutyrivibrio sp. YE44]
MRRKLLATLVAATMVFSMTACGVTAPDTSSTTGTASIDDAKTPTSGETITLVMAEVNPLDTVVGMVDSKFKEEVETRSNGTIKIDLQAGGVLGSENDVVDGMLGGGGTVDISRISAFILTPYGGEKSKLLSLPYTFVSREHYWKFATSKLADDFLMEPYENGNGIRGLFYGEEGFRHFFTKEEITGIDSFKGMKLRVSNDPVMNGLAESLGANPTVVSFGELYSALQTGVVDGAEQPITNYKSNAFPEVAPYMILDGHTIGATEMIISDDTWNKLTEEQQNILIEAGKAAQEYNQTIADEQEAKTLEELKKDGVTIIDVEDKTPWQKAVQSVIDDNIKGQEELYKQIVDMK